jgi:hypothetical protein
MQGERSLMYSACSFSHLKVKYRGKDINGNYEYAEKFSKDTQET